MCGQTYSTWLRKCPFWISVLVWRFRNIPSLTTEVVPGHILWSCAKLLFSLPIFRSPSHLLQFEHPHVSVRLFFCTFSLGYLRLTRWLSDWKKVRVRLCLLFKSQLVLFWLLWIRVYFLFQRLQKLLLWWIFPGMIVKHHCKMACLRTSALWLQG